MLELRPGIERGLTQTGWLDSRHTFSFKHYFDPNYVGFGPLRVINDDRVIPGAGFGTHGHRDMEILTWVLSGAIDHKDSMGNGSTVRPGEIQSMTAGTGITHSEFNHSATESLHFLQIWIVPDQKGLTPGYEQRQFSGKDLSGKLRLIASNDGREGSVKIHQNASVHLARLEPGRTIEKPLAADRAWVQVARGEISLNGQLMREGDGAALTGEKRLQIESSAESEVVLFELP
jgi:redox-sensitive bicupin YhaK (pirin superfamily)